MAETIEFIYVWDANPQPDEDCVECHDRPKLADLETCYRCSPDDQAADFFWDLRGADNGE